MPSPLISVVVALGLAVAVSRGAEAQSVAPDSAGRSTLAGVYSASQAEKGQQTYRKNCTACHAPAAYTGAAFRRLWNGRPVYEFFNLVRTTMPNDSPGKLARGQYAEIMAYLFKLNGLPSGETDLPGDDDALKRIVIEVPPP